VVLGKGKSQIKSRLFSMMEQTKQLFQRRTIYLMYICCSQREETRRFMQDFLLS